MKGYVGIPFVDGGREMTGCDCWGLIRLVHRREKSIELPSYGEISAMELLKVAREMKTNMGNGDPWVNVDDQPRREFDCVVMRELEAADRIPWHIGIMVDANKMLHTEASADSHTVALTDYNIKPRILGFFRHRDLL